MHARNGLATGFSLLFAQGTRPDGAIITQALSRTELAGAAITVSHRLGAEPQWLELLSNGMTFDLTGLEPGLGASLVDPRHRFGFEAGAFGGDAGKSNIVELEADHLEAITLAPGPHLAGSGTLQPVVRTMAAIAANLALNLDTRAVCWHASQSWMEPRYFSRIVLNWLSGGAFPALGLTALAPASDGSILSSGLAHFIGQEVQVQAREGESQADTIRLAIRVIDYLVRHGPLDEAREIAGTGETLQAEPSQFGNLVWIWRSG